MGHYTETFEVKATEQNRGKLNLIFDDATSQWTDEADRYSDLRSYGAQFRPAVTERQYALVWDEDSDSFLDELAPVYPIAAVKSSKTLQKKLQVTGEELVSLRSRQFTSYRLSALARAQFGPTVAHAEFVSAPALRAPIAKSTEGKLVTSYHVLRDTRSVASFDTMAEARAKALQIMKDDTEGTIRELNVQAKVTRDTGANNLLVISRPTADATLTVKVTFEVPDETKIGSYKVSLHHHS